MSQEPNHSLSHKLRQLGRLNLKPRHGAGDKGAAQKPSPLDTNFRIVHTPDRLVTARPIPSVEECREEIKRWHREAAKRGQAADSDGDDDDDDEVEFSLTPTVSRETSTRESRRLAGEWAIQSTRRVASPEISVGGDDGRWDGSGLGAMSLDGGDGKEGPSNTRNKTKDLSYGAFPIFQPLPGQIPRETNTSTNKIKTPPVPKPAGFLSPEDTQKAYTTPRKSPLDKQNPPVANEYTFPPSSFSSSASSFDSDSDSDFDDSDTPTPTIQPLPHPIHQNLYASGLCPSCQNPRSKIEARRCGRCQAHLSAYYNRRTSGSHPESSSNNYKDSPEPAGTRTQRPISPLSTASGPQAKSPPPLRERVFLSRAQASASQAREQNARKQAASPTPAPVPVPKEKRGSASLRNMAVSPARDYTYLPLVESERRPVFLREGKGKGQGPGRGEYSRSRSNSSSRGRRREVIGLGLGLGLERGEEDPRYVAEGDDADLLVSIYEEYDDGEGGVGENRSRFTFGGYV